jgi:ankyrin repeat protein
MKRILLGLVLMAVMVVYAPPVSASVTGEIISRMSELRSSLDAHKEAKGTYLGLVSSKKGVEIVRKINDLGSSPIVIATSKDAYCMMKNVGTVNYCIDSDSFEGAGVGCSKDNIRCLTREQLIGRIKELIEARAPMTPDRALLRAVEEDDLEGVRVALKNGGDPNQTYMGAPLIIGTFGQEDTDMLKEFIKAGADLNKVYKYEARNSYMSFEKLLDGLTPLSFAIMVNKREVVDILLVAGADPNLTKSELGLTPIIVLIGSDTGNGIDTLKSLLKHGANPNVKVNFSSILKEIGDIDDFEGVEYAKLNNFNAANLAAAKNDVDMLREIIKAGGNVKNKTDGGLDSLLLSLLGSYSYPVKEEKVLDTVKELLKYVDVNARIETSKGTLSPLLASINNPSVVKELIKAGAVVNQPGKIDGKEVSSLPLYVAILNEHEETIKILEDAGAKLSDADKQLTKARYNEKIKATMDQMRSAAELEKIEKSIDNYSSLGDYFDVLLKSVNDMTGGHDVPYRTPVTYEEWCFSVQLPGNGTYWCVDSDGYAGVPVGNDTCKTSFSCK